MLRRHRIKIQEFAPVYDASPLPPLAQTALTQIIAAVEDYLPGTVSSADPSKRRASSSAFTSTMPKPGKNLTIF